MRERWPFGICNDLGLQAPEADQLARQVADWVDYLYFIKAYEQAEDLDALLAEFIEWWTGALDEVSTESWNMTGSVAPEGETGIEDYETGDGDDEAPRFEYWEPDMLVAADDGSWHGRRYEP